MIQGPNVRKLIVRKMTLIMVPACGGLQSVASCLTRPGGIEQAAREASDWVETVLSSVKSSLDNPYGDDDEAIAGEILSKAGLK